MSIKSLVQCVLLALICCASTASTSIAKDPDVPIPLKPIEAILEAVTYLVSGGAGGTIGGGARLHYREGGCVGCPRRLTSTHLHYHKNATAGGSSGGNIGGARH